MTKTEHLETHTKKKNEHDNNYPIIEIKGSKCVFPTQIT